MKVNSICRSLLVIATVGVPGFVKFDSSGLTQDHGLINAQSIARMVVYSIIGFIFVSLLLFRPPKSLRPQTPVNHFWAIGLLAYYVIFLIISAGVLPTRGIAIASYRVVEWVMLISLCWYYYHTLQSSSAGLNRVSDEFIHCLRWITSLPVWIVLVGLIFFPDLAYSFSSETGTYRFGGYLFYPNGLGVLCGIGSVLFWILPRNRVDRLWSIALFGFMILTYSRGAMVGFVMFLLYYNLIFCSFVRKISAVFVLLVVFIIFVSGSASDYFNDAATVASRGENIATTSTLNGRTEVWETSLKIIADSPWVGQGYIQGPKKIKEYFMQKWWAPSHAHNDLLNAAIAGGIGMAAFTLFIYILLAFKNFRLKRPARIKAVTGAVLIQCIAYSLLTPALSTHAHGIGITLIVLTGFLFAQPPSPEKKTHLSAVHAN